MEHPVGALRSTPSGQPLRSTRGETPSSEQAPTESRGRYQTIGRMEEGRKDGNEICKGAWNGGHGAVMWLSRYRFVRLNTAILNRRAHRGGWDECLCTTPAGIRISGLLSGLKSSGRVGGSVKRSWCMVTEDLHGSESTVDLSFQLALVLLRRFGTSQCSHRRRFARTKAFF